MSRSHLVIPDTQVKPKVNTDHLEAIANYTLRHKPDVIICLGDFADMPSLSQYDGIGSKKTEGQRYSDDVASVQDAMGRLITPLREYNNKRKSQNKKQYRPQMVLTLGNHEDRITRAIKQNPRHFEGVISLSDLQYEEWGWEVVPFLEIIEIDGILYSHYFINTDSAKKNVLGGTITNRIRSVGKSFTQGHAQGLHIGMRDTVDGRRLRGLVCGSFYAHLEDYMGPQGNPHWRGCVHKTEVCKGDYSLRELSLDYLIKEWL